MSQFFKTPAYFQNPFFRYIFTYMTVFALICWSTYIFKHYRVVGNIIFSIMPAVGTVTMYLWIILLADEFVDLLKSYGPMRSIIKKLKILSFIVIAFYGIMAFALLVNKTSYEPAITRTTKIITISKVNMGAIDYSLLTAASWGSGTGTISTLLRNTEEGVGLYPGGDIEIVMRKGILSLDRVLEINRDAEKYYLKMLEVAPDSQVAVGRLVNIYSKRNEFEKALKWYDRLLEKSPDEYDIGLELGWRLVEGRRYKLAVPVLRKVSGIKRTYEVLYMLGYALAWSGEKYEAEKYLTEATELDPTDFRAFYSLGYVYRDTARYVKAKEAWTKVLELLPDFPEVENNIKSIKNKY